MAGLATLTDPARPHALNDAFRRSFTGGRVVVTAGVASLAADTRSTVLTTVRAFDTDNDLHGDHDFGALMVARAQVFWKVDAYDGALAGASPDPSDPVVTTRVLTIMLAEDY